MIFNAKCRWHDFWHVFWHELVNSVFLAAAIVSRVERDTYMDRQTYRQPNRHVAAVYMSEYKSLYLSCENGLPLARCDLKLIYTNHIFIFCPFLVPSRQQNICKKVIYDCCIIIHFLSIMITSEWRRNSFRLFITPRVYLKSGSRRLRSADADRRLCSYLIWVNPPSLNVY
jgi:hypothetical protein